MMIYRLASVYVTVVTSALPRVFGASLGNNSSSFLYTVYHCANYCSGRFLDKSDLSNILTLTMRMEPYILFQSIQVSISWRNVQNLDIAIVALFKI